MSDSGKDAFWGVSDDNEEGQSLLMGDGVEGISASAACCDVKRVPASEFFNRQFSMCCSTTDFLN